MPRIDKTKPVLVTGATGYVASWIVKKLVEAGITVHAAVRNPHDESKVKHLKNLVNASTGKLVLFKSDLLEKGSYADAMKECEVVIHTASPFSTSVKDVHKELLDPAVKGTQYVLETACATPSVKRVVLTSSCAAIYTDAIECQHVPNGKLTEAIWNTTATESYQPYSLSKTLAERKAWDIANAQSQWDLVTINPSFVLGPMLNPSGTTSESFSLLKQLVDGTMRMGVPKMGIGLVDVRDVAEAHIKAAFTPEANGRYLTSAHNTDFYEMAMALQSKYGSTYPLPKKILPKWLLLIIGPWVNKLMTRRFIQNNVNIPWKADNGKIIKDFKLDFIPLQQTMEDSMQALIEAKIV